MPETPSAKVSDESPTSATPTWINLLPEWGGIRENVASSPFRWCVRESLLWGVASGTTMGLHRLRMKSRPFFAFNVAFGTTFLVAMPSYYFCFKRREHKEATIEMMMRANDFENVEEMPEEIPVDQHPFMTSEEDEKKQRKNFVARLKEKKEWQKQDGMKNVEDVFKKEDN
uniref:Cytochrome c oxidase assembly protein COX20, mitochondrial n=1 Tax=Chaetoceros debilis TaxID=122233 RepID=A0A7S3QIZ6_9STRA|mmetsp:Transcript_22115/g.33632  ORF Transcript_22115/g.33632 Transcript_22115/m.33632 type:complete len:171 (-) Transcript_22115:25-537(-)|eukprot:CAMPEP_0194081876 /NCGR_PEP_ID=MMETSP0149-20130528/7545_1 /TAXON_ID=122233 /ORGANISM="Chaetoceros debilis, Strain MM31A-1" /LENGTH=170 /DNA_ID=CAMNT_0038763891 /DNA_START=118 /DNA_END=630 /DNA_ORIENTATION=+